MKSRDPISGVLLTHGAGGDSQHHTLAAIDRGLELIPVERVNFPYRDEGRRSPPRADRVVPFIVEQAGALAARLSVPGDEIVLGGRSFGGRVCSMAVGGGLQAAGLLLLSYPLHAPGKPEQMRVEHFPQIAVPCLFISGTKDAFATRDELEQATTAIAGPVTHVWLDSEGHDPKKSDPAIVAAVVDWLENL